MRLGKKRALLATTLACAKIKFKLYMSEECALEVIKACAATPKATQKSKLAHNDKKG